MAWFPKKSKHRPRSWSIGTAMEQFLLSATGLMQTLFKAVCVWMRSYSIAFPPIQANLELKLRETARPTSQEVSRVGYKGNGSSAHNDHNYAGQTTVGGYLNLERRLKAPTWIYSKSFLSASLFTKTCFFRELVKRLLGNIFLIILKASCTCLRSSVNV